MDDQTRTRLANQMSRGDVILFTGAGFSLSAKAVAGHPVPSVQRLRELLWPVAFPGEPLDDDSSLGDIFDCALGRARNQTRDILNANLRVEPSTLPGVYEEWFSMPWYRLYTLNIDDLDESVNRKFPLPRPIRSVSALRDELPAADVG